MKKSILGLVLVLVMVVGNMVSVNAQTLVFDPAENDNWYYHGVFYGRGIELKAGEGKGNIYLTSEYYYKPGKWGQEHFPIFESTDGGQSFSHISDIYDTEFTKKKWMKAEDGSYYEVPEETEGSTTYMGEWWSMLYQPFLFELPEDFGSLSKGTVLCVGTTRANNHCAIVIYYSTDNLRTWNYLSTVAEGGKCEMEKASAIWEGFLVYENNSLYCFYSDERGMTGGGQRLVMKKSADAINWSEDIKVCDFEEENDHFRPGMPVVTKLPDGRFMLVYEGVNMGSPHPGYYKITDDIEVWDSKSHGTQMPKIFWGGSPYCTTLGDKVIIGGHGTNKIGVNLNSVMTDEWIAVDTDIEVGYSRCLFPMENGNLLITSGGNWNVQGARKLVFSIEEPDIGKEVKPVSVSGTTPWGENEPNWDNKAENIIDSNNTTFFDGLQDGFAIVDLGKEVNVCAIGYMPRFNFGFRMKGSEFYGSLDGQTWTKLATVETAPSNEVVTYADVAQGNYRYIKYNTNGEEFCSVAEIKVYMNDSVAVNVENGVLNITSDNTRTTLAGVFSGNGSLVKTLIFTREGKCDYEHGMEHVKVFQWDKNGLHITKLNIN